MSPAGRSRSYFVVEGHGEDGAVPALVSVLWNDLRLPWRVWDSRLFRQRGLHHRDNLMRALERYRADASCGSVLVLRDDEDGCPKLSAPTASRWVAEAKLPFPVALVHFYREYETLFLASLPSLAGKPLHDPSGRARPGVQAGAVFGREPESVRDAKGALSKLMHRPYKPTTDQLALTRLIDFGLLRSPELACFGTLERALRFLAAATGTAVYPPPT